LSQKCNKEQHFFLWSSKQKNKKHVQNKNKNKVRSTMIIVFAH